MQETGLTSRSRSVVLFTPLALAALTACPNDHVFLPIPQCSTVVIEETTPMEISNAADILIVVDNSGSMCEEQTNLGLNFYDPSCPLTDLKNIPEEFRNPPPEVVQQLAQNCGFIQILAAYENDFRVGVITTDVAPCDNQFNVSNVPQHPNLCDGQAKPEWGRRPMRGCLQRPLGEERKFISRDDDDDIGLRFRDTLDAIQTLGHPLERGLDAVKIFLSPNEEKHPDCEEDLGDFIREDASLVVIFLTDEDDCSHDVTDTFGDENVNDDYTCPGGTDGANLTVQPAFCYSERSSLRPVEGYTSFLQNYKGPLRQTDVRVAVIAGGMPTADDVTPSACTIVGGIPDGTCTPSFGNSNFDAPGQICDPASLANNGDPPCCLADSGDRYLQLADGFGAQGLSNSICFDNFRQTMVQIAQFAAASDKVDLGNTPANDVAIIVKIKRQGQNDPETIDRIPAADDPTDRSGWKLEGCCTIRFYGDAKPQPGDEVIVNALGESENASEECTGDFGDEDAGN